MEWHPIASVFPMMSDDDLQGLADNIRANGQKQPITLFEGKVLDGRNRWAACTLAGVEQKTVEFKGTRAEALDHAWSLNRVRRHLDSSQAAIAEARRAKLSEEYGAEVEKLKAEAADRKSGKGTERKGTNSPTLNKPAESNKVREQRAKAAGTNAKYIDAADRIEAERPDLGDKILKGEMTIPQATREMRVAEQVAAIPVESHGKTARDPIGVVKANEAVNCLKAIPKNDALRKRGFQIVTDWIKQNSKES